MLSWQPKRRSAPPERDSRAYEIGREYGQPQQLQALLGDRRLAAQSNSPLRAQVMQSMQRTYGNRAVQRALSTKGAGQIAVQRKDYSPSLPPFLMGPLTMGFDYLLQSIGPSSLPPIADPAQPSISEMVQEHIARAQGAAAFYERQQAEKHDQEIDGAQRAITGLPPDWFMQGKDPKGMLEQPQYHDVSPALNSSELEDLQWENEVLGAARHG